MNKYVAVISITFIIVLFGFIQIFGCIGDDDDDVTPTPTMTPIEETPTPTVTPTVTPTPYSEDAWGTLNIWTTPVAGDIYVDGEWQGCGVWQGKVAVGSYTISFGEIAGYPTPDDIIASVQANETTHVEGVYMITFIRTYEIGDLDYGFSLDQTSDGGYVIAGSKDYFSEECDICLVKTDYIGNLIWSRTFGGSGLDYGRSVIQASDGGFAIAGATDSYGAGFFDVYLIKTDSNGNIRWSKTFGGSAWDFGYSLEQTSDGGYIIAGSTRSYGAGNTDVYLIKTDGNGNQLWSKTFGGSGFDEGYSVQQTVDGGFIIAGETRSYGIAEYRVYLIKTDKNGNEIWSKTFRGNNYAVGYYAEQTNDGGYIVTGCNDEDFLLLKTDSTGNELWSTSIGGYRTDHGQSVHQTIDGGYIIVGWKGYIIETYDSILLVKTDSNGSVLWTREYGEGFDYSNDQGYSVEQTYDGGYIFTGHLGEKICLIKTDSEGQVYE
ncbi:hypothetical protein JXQ70_01360 [bacterium]|nr:hypothetical protein [bacterium]